MLRIAIAVAALLACASALAQSYSGTFSTRNDRGGLVTLSLKQDAAGNVAGTLSGNGSSFRVEARMVSDGVLGTASSDAGSLILAAQLQPNGKLKVMLAEPLANGTPNVADARRFEMVRTGSAPQAAAPAPSRPANPMNPAAPGPGPGQAQAQAQAGQDGQISQFLMGNAWCGFTYNKVSGASHTERVVFHGNGVVSKSSGGETYSSGAAGSVAGQYRGGDQGRWKVQGGQLQLSRDGFNWEPQTIQVTRNSNGSPILKSNGKEYMVCR